jgi:thioredoxin reductase (NADPH)
MSTVDTREHQRFPVLNAPQIETARRFASGPEVRFAPGDAVYAIGDHDAPAWLVLTGLVRAGSTKRVAAAVGEGAAVVAQIHAMFAAQPAEEMH